MEIGLVGVSQEAEPVGHDLERAVADHEALARRPGFEELEDEFLFGERLVVFEPVAFGDLADAFDVDALEVGESERVFECFGVCVCGDFFEFGGFAFDLFVGGEDVVWDGGGCGL